MSLDLKNKGPKACTTCAKAKSRCIPGPEGSDKCERCYRLTKPCTSQTPAPPRAKKEPRPTKVAELEKRLNELTSQLRSAQTASKTASASASVAAGPAAILQGSGSSSSSSSSTPVKSSTKPITKSAKSTSTTTPVPLGRPTIGRAGGKGYQFKLDHLFPPATAEDDDDYAQSHGSDDLGFSPRTMTTDPASKEGSPESDNGSPATGASGSAWAPAPESPLIVTDVPWPSGPEADRLLRRFRDELEPIYPFVITPPDLDAALLALRHPFLFKGVIVSAYYDDAYRQLRLGDRLLQEITRAAFTQPHRSLDLVQALQLFIAWFQYNANSYQLTNLLFLVRSMCLTLGFNDAVCGPNAGGGVDGIVHSLDHLRAFVGCYYVTTVVFTTSKRADAFMNTTYVEKCCTVLEQRAEYATDRLVVSLFKILQLEQSICVTLGADNSLYPSMQVPTTAVVQSFQQQLDMYRAALPDDLKTNEPILSHVRIAEMLMYEAAIPDSRASRVPVSESDRLSLLWACLSAAKAYLEERHSRSVVLPPRYTCLSASDWIYVIITGLKLHTIEVDGWDVSMVREQLPLGQLVARQLEDLDRYIVVRRQGRKGGQLVPYTVLGNVAKVQPSRPVFDVYEQIRHINGHMAKLGAQEIEAMVQRSNARQQRRREMQHAQMTPAQLARQQLDLGQQQEMQRQAQLHQNQDHHQYNQQGHHQEHQQEHQHQHLHQQIQASGMMVPGLGQLAGLPGGAPTMATSQGLRDFDGSLWQDTFDDSAWFLGADAASMDWANSF